MKENMPLKDFVRLLEGCQEAMRTGRDLTAEEKQFVADRAGMFKSASPS